MTQHLSPPRIATRAEWLAARADLLEQEKVLTRQRMTLAEQRRRMPWVRLDKPYMFDGPNGAVALPALFGGNRQLAVYHFMFAPSWKAGCKSCSLAADHFDRTAAHLAHHDVTVVAVSRAPFAALDAFRRRMGWTFPWFSSDGTEFNRDFNVSAPPEQRASGSVTYNFKQNPASARYINEEMHGLSVFAKDAAGDVFHTYTNYQRFTGWRVAPAWLDGREVLAVFQDAGARPAYIIELAVDGDRIAAIRDFRHIPYIARDARCELTRKKSASRG